MPAEGLRRPARLGQRANDFPILNPLSDAREPAVPAGGLRRPTRLGQRANDFPILNPLSDAREPAVPAEGLRRPARLDWIFFVYFVVQILLVIGLRAKPALGF